jgi:hypothetical protein
MAKKKRKKSRKSSRKTPRAPKKRRAKRKGRKSKRRNIGRVGPANIRHAPTDVLESELKDAKMMAGTEDGAGFKKLANRIAAELRRRKKGGAAEFGFRKSKKKKKAKYATDFYSKMKRAKAAKAAKADGAPKKKRKKAKAKKEAPVKKKRKSTKKKAGKGKSSRATIARLRAQLAACMDKPRRKRKSRKASARSTMVAKRARVAKRRKICDTKAKRKPVVCRPNASEKSKAGCVVAAKRHGVPAKKTCGPGTKGLKKSASRLASARWDNARFWGD